MNSRSSIVHLIRRFASPVRLNALTVRRNGISSQVVIAEHEEEHKKWVGTSEAKAVLSRSNNTTAKDVGGLKAVARDSKLTKFEIFNGPEGFVHASSMRDYLLARGYILESAPGFRIASSLHSFPLTLSYGINKLSPVCSFPAQSAALNILSIGARAESSLPPYFWAECLYACSSRSSNLSITWQGPGLQPRHSQSDVITLSRPSLPSRQLQLSLLPDGKTLLHLHPQLQSVLDSTQLYVLFNPGYGSTAELVLSWAPSIEILLRTGAPILATAHSKHDLNRDIAALRTIVTSMNKNKKDGMTCHISTSGSTSAGASASASASTGANTSASASVRASSEKLHVEEDLDINIPGLQFLLPPHKNPFASEKMTFDPNEHPDAQKVTTNEYVYAFRGL